MKPNKFFKPLYYSLIALDIATGTIVSYILFTLIVRAV